MRLFLALWPDDAVRRACAERGQALQRDLELGGRLVPAERLHLTLHFLGDVPAERLADVLSAAAGVSARPCELVLDLAGSFRGRGTPCWLGASSTPAELLALHSALGARLQAAGFRVDAAQWQPHLTFVRGARRQLRRTPIEPLRWPVADFVLVESLLDRSPIEYRLVPKK